MYAWLSPCVCSSIAGGKFYLDIRVPVNTTARVYLPTDKAASVREGGVPDAV